MPEAATAIAIRDYDLSAAEAMQTPGQGSEHIFEDRAAAGMIQRVRLRCLTMEIRSFQDSRDCGILADAAVINPIIQPLPGRFTTNPDQSDQRQMRMFTRREAMNKDTARELLAGP